MCKKNRKKRNPWAVHQKTYEVLGWNPCSAKIIVFNFFKNDVNNCQLFAKRDFQNHKLKSTFFTLMSPLHSMLLFWRFSVIVSNKNHFIHKDAKKTFHRQQVMLSCRHSRLRNAGTPIVAKILWDFSWGWHRLDRNRDPV